MKKEQAPFLRTEHNYDRDAATKEDAITFKDESRTKQSFKEESDINEIVRRFGLTGQLPEGIRAPEYGDFEGIYDFHSAMNQVAAAREAFEAMPAEIRTRFHNDPGAFVDFCSKEENREEMKKMGLIVKSEAPPTKGGEKGDPGGEENLKTEPGEKETPSEKGVT